ncbi:MAG: hypothetical protein GY874_21340 [Desulfobacteraceae bacterium]|nr:hypothetical protein [Desulfobacteraceae bacterium]
MQDDILFDTNRLKSAMITADNNIMETTRAPEKRKPALVRVMAVLLAVVLISCASKPQSKTHHSAGTAHNYPGSSTGTARELRDAVIAWIGTPHKMGGDNRRGIDCSGFVKRIYNDVFGIKMPRTAVLQLNSGFSVNRNNLKAGDLIFFRPPYKANHVGIYLGNGEFAHASKSKGVMISKLQNPYWRDCYWSARRILKQHN